MVEKLKFLGVALLVVTAAFCLEARADIRDMFDPFDFSTEIDTSEEGDKDKTPEQLIKEAQILLADERPLDARTKLLRALQKDPKAYKAHLMLAAYYMVHVGHFRLALKYVKQGENLFLEKNGQPPYKNFLIQSEHAHILYLLSQSRLNLDNYRGALEILDRFSDLGYFADWYPGTRAWILMKLGEIDEAVRVARLGVMTGSEPGRSLNMLGILLSMKNERQASIDIFRQAINYEMALGNSGQPATPLNNVGEVYKEIFEEDRAISSWLKATSMPDGCEHVLPSLNLALLYLDDLNFQGSKRAIDNFEGCVAQFPLRNGEEHRALVHLARGRIDLHTGKVDSAIAHFDAALDRRQWFGKIGTSEDDMRAAAMTSMAQALLVKNNHIATSSRSSWRESLEALQNSAKNSLNSWWLRRRAKQILIEDLAALEDLYIRNTDSLLEYPSLGFLLRDIPANLIEARIAKERDGDGRWEANLYYNAYLAENMLESGEIGKTDELLNQIIAQTRGQHDDALRMRALVLKLKILSPNSEDYATLAHEAFSLSRAALRNEGLALPVNWSGNSQALVDLLGDVNFRLNNELNLAYSIDAQFKDGEYVLEFIPAQTGTVKVRVSGADAVDAVNKFSTAVFSQELS
ncbi:MAG: hypothetical protein DCC75_04425 [Proteobacteria bacterium]|nr:MAG: hypothetical protein DCC75_04425 [Pseudomonadota bacterium]